jgi:hypothetical protein
MPFPAKFDSRCPLCLKTVNAGDRAAWNRVLRKVCHASCMREALSKKRLDESPMLIHMTGRA